MKNGFIRVALGWLAGIGLLCGLPTTTWAMVEIISTKRADGSPLMGGNAASFGASISGDGRFVAFSSRASDLVATDTDALEDVFVFSTETGTTELLTSSPGTGGRAGAINADGRFVVFSSTSLSLVPTNINGVRIEELFVYDRATDTIEAITPGADGPSSESTISADGRFVAFSSSASNLTGGDFNGVQDVFIHDRVTGLTESITSQGNNVSLEPSISPDGGYVAFASAASNLVAPDPNGNGQDIFIYNRMAGTTELITSGGNAESGAPSIGAEGQVVAFQSRATNLVVSNFTGIRPGLFVYDRSSQAVRFFAQRGANPAITPDGRFVVFETDNQPLLSSFDLKVLRVFDLQTFNSEELTFLVFADSTDPSISADGRLTAFTSIANNFLNDGNTFLDVFLATQNVPVAGNTRPVAVTELRLSTSNNQPATITLEGTDADGDPLTFLVNTQPAPRAGTVTGTPPNVTFTPTPGFVGSSIFTFVASDGLELSRPGRVVLSVLPAVNRPPVATPLTLATPRDVPLILPLAGTDPDGDTLRFFIDRDTIVGGRLTPAGLGAPVEFVPTSGFVGTASLTYVAIDRVSRSEPATVTIEVGGTDTDVFCGDPRPNPVVDQGTFVWRDCVSDIWQVRVLAGQSSGRLDYSGTITNVSSVLPVLIETADLLDQTSLPGSLSYELVVYDESVDGFDFTLRPNSEACLTPQLPGGLPVFLGGSRSLLSEASIQLDTGLACVSAIDSDGDGLSDADELALGTNPNQADTDGSGVNDGDELANGTDPLNGADDVNLLSDACGSTFIRSGSERAVFLTSSCDGSGEWSLRVSGGGVDTPLRYIGEIRTPGGISGSRFTGSSLDTNDFIDRRDPNVLAYELTIFGDSADGFDFTINATEACFTHKAPFTLPVYLGANRVPLAGTTFDLINGGSCTTLQDSDGDGLSDAEEQALGSDLNIADTDGGSVNDGDEIANGTDPLNGTDDILETCGMPPFDPAGEQGLFLWRDCNVSGVERWQLRLTGGGLPFAFFDGELAIASPATPVPVNLEPHDSLDAQPDDALIDYRFGVGENGVDGFEVDLALGSDNCFDPLASNIPIHVGESRIPVSGAFDLRTLGACSAPDFEPECGAPNFNAATEPGLYIWRDCEAPSTDARWKIRTAGGGLPWLPYRGELTATTTPLRTTGVDLESNDTLDTVPGDALLDFILNVGGTGQDGFEIDLPAGEAACFDVQTVPAGAGVFLGQGRLAMTEPFNLIDFGACSSF